MTTLSLIASILHYALNIYIIIVLVGALISWVNPSPHNPVVRFLNRATFPVLAWFRKRLPLRFGGVDFSPIAVIAALVFLDIFLVGILRDQGNVLAWLLIGLGQVAHIFLTLYMWLVIIGALLTWISPDPYNPIVRIIYAATEPSFAWLRRNLRLPLNLGGIDFSPMLLILAVVLADRLVVRFVIYEGIRMKTMGMLPF